MYQEVITFFAAAVRTSTPLLIAALGLIYGQRAGVRNIGAEGMMLIGALVGVAGSYYTGNPWIGALLASLAGALTASIFAFLVVTARAYPPVCGTAINLFGLGLSTVLARVIFGMNTTMPEIPSFSRLSVPVLSGIPFLGPVLFQQNPLVYVTIIVLPIAHYLLFKTELGLKIRAVGEHPKACDTLGINVYAIRYGTIIFGGFMCGLAGAYVSMALLSFFTENMIAGRGFIALAVVTCGNFNPLGALGAALLFGAGEAVQYRLQAAGTGIPYQFAAMIPYVITLFALSGLIGKPVQPPASSGVPYVKE
ncbi:MAG: ABC transporter permease [Bacillota bacterium]